METHGINTIDKDVAGDSISCHIFFYGIHSMFPTLYVSLSYLLYYFLLILCLLKVVRIQGIPLVETFETFCINIKSDEHVKKNNSDEHVNICTGIY